jgi:hypothetical protein
MKRHRQVPVVIAVVLAAGGAIAVPAGAQDKGSGGEIYVTQAGDAARSGGHAGADPSLPAGLRLRDNLFRTPAAGLTTPSSGPGITSSDGTGNRTTIEQSGTDNVVAVRQYGTRNVASVVQLGSANRLDAVQNGTANVLHVALAGSDNALGLVQRGEDNRYSLDFRGSGLDHAVVQEGIGLRATQVGVGSLPFGIQQRGTGMEITVQHNGGR